MNLNMQRPWITPLVIGTFTLMAVTGVLMFFHLDSGLNKTAHEWLGWAMVAAAAQVAGISTTDLRAKLDKAGVATQNDTQTIRELVGSDLGDQMRTLSKVFTTDSQR